MCNGVICGNSLTSQSPRLRFCPVHFLAEAQPLDRGSFGVGRTRVEGSRDCALPGSGPSPAWSEVDNRSQIQCNRRAMLLPREEAELLFKLHSALMQYVNSQLKVIDVPESPYAALPPRPTLPGGEGIS